jgi:hypothetical protein
MDGMGVISQNDAPGIEQTVLFIKKYFYTIAIRLDPTFDFPTFQL